ncbi:MAG: hypothetical protein HQ478_15425 [Chloroflexi bacterium]|nr:hypothetical protein [Chloroflexota bacterium]
MPSLNLNHKSSWKRIALPGVIALAAIAVACSGGGDDESPTAAPTTAPTVAPTASTQPTSVPAPAAAPTAATIAVAPTAAPAPKTDPAPSATPRPVPTAAPAPTAITVPPTATTVPTTPAPTNTPIPTPTQSALDEFFLAFSTPEFFDDFVEKPEYTIVGRTRVDAFVTIEETIVDVDENGQFSLAVTLEEGINVFEVVASVSDTEQLNEVLTVIYAP